MTALVARAAPGYGTAMTEPVLSVRDLARRVRHAARRAEGDRRRLVRHRPGEVLGVVGESGAGKSVTGSAVIGLIDPPGRIAGGEIRLSGERIDNLPHEEMRRCAASASA